MCNRDEVLEQYGLNLGSSSNEEVQMAHRIAQQENRIRELEAQLQSVTVTEAMVDAVVRFLYRHFDIILNRDGATKMLTAALTNMKNI